MTTKASEGQVSKEDVADYLASGERTIALAAMRGEHRLITGDVIAESIDHSRSGMEQFYALLVAREGWSSLPPVTKRQVVQAIERDGQGRRFMTAGTARAVVAKEVLDLARQEGTL